MVTEQITMRGNSIVRTKNNAAALEIARAAMIIDRVIYHYSRKHSDRCNFARSIQRVEELLGLPHRFHANGRKI